MLIKSSEDYYKALTAAAIKSDHCIITSFGVFAGIGYDGDINDKFPSEERKFLDVIKNHPDISMIIGVHGYYSPYNPKISPGHCRHCIQAYTRRALRIEKHREIFPNINWYSLHSLHSKVAVFWGQNHTIAMVGSRNFTNSPNHELSICISNTTDAESVKEYAIGLKEIANPVSIDSMIDFLVQETGSDYCLKMMCGEA